MNIADGKGAFKADQSGIHFQDLNVLISGQQATGSGSVLLDAAAQTLNFNLSLPDIDAAALFGGLAVAKPFAVSLTITGPVNHPVMTGNFSSPEIAAGGLAVGGVSGAMSYEAGRLNLQQASGTAYQGQLTLAGVILTATESYELTASGSGMNSSALTDKDVQGPLDFTARVSGAGEAAVARGDFIIRNGKAYGISFQSLTGSFIKRGGATEIFDIAVNTPLGTLYPEQLSREALEKLSERNIPTSREEVKKAATDALIKRIFR